MGPGKRQVNISHSSGSIQPSPFAFHNSLPTSNYVGRLPPKDYPRLAHHSKVCSTWYIYMYLLLLHCICFLEFSTTIKCLWTDCLLATI